MADERQHDSRRQHHADLPRHARVPQRPPLEQVRKGRGGQLHAAQVEAVVLREHGAVVVTQAVLAGRRGRREADEHRLVAEAAVRTRTRQIDHARIGQGAHAARRPIQVEVGRAAGCAQQCERRVDAPPRRGRQALGVALQREHGQRGCIGCAIAESPVGIDTRGLGQQERRVPAHGLLDGGDRQRRALDDEARQRAAAAAVQRQNPLAQRLAHEHVPRRPDCRGELRVLLRLRRRRIEGEIEHDETRALLREVAHELGMQSARPVARPVGQAQALRRFLVEGDDEHIGRRLDAAARLVHPWQAELLLEIHPRRERAGEPPSRRDDERQHQHPLQTTHRAPAVLASHSSGWAAEGKARNRLT